MTVGAGTVVDLLYLVVLLHIPYLDVLRWSRAYLPGESQGRVVQSPVKLIQD